MHHFASPSLSTEGYRPNKTVRRGNYFTVGLKAAANQGPTLSVLSQPIRLERVFLSNYCHWASSPSSVNSPISYARQLSDRSLFHAGRYLSDKEIRYLGTLIVKADVSSLEDWSHLSADPSHMFMPTLV